jgi:hypothetical protein
MPNHLIPTAQDLTKMRSWEFSAMQDAELSDKYRWAWGMFSSLGLTEKFDVQPHVFSEFIFELQRLYNCRNNPFHNFDHSIMGILTVTLPSSFRSL